MEPIYIILIILLIILLLSFCLVLYIHHKMFGSRWEPNNITKYYNIEMFDGLEKKPLEFKYKKNILRGNLYFYKREEYKGIVVVSHGMWGSHRAYLQDIEYLARNNFKVFGFDYTGTESSDGKNIKGLGNSLPCLNAAINFIKTEYHNMPIFVYGHSWGGFASLGISKYHKDIRAIVALAPFVSVLKVFRGFTKGFVKLFVPFCVLVDFIKCGSSSLYNNKRIIDKSSVQTLIIHSKDDKIVKFDNCSYLQKTKNTNIKFLIVNDKNHNPNYTLDAVQYTNNCMLKAKELNKEEKVEYFKKLDYIRMGKLDTEVMDSIVQFYNQNL